MKRVVVFITIVLALFVVSPVVAKTKLKSKTGTELQLLYLQLDRVLDDVLDTLQNYRPMVEKLSETNTRTACNTLVAVEYRRPLEEMERNITRAANILKAASALAKKGERVPQKLSRAVRKGALTNVQRALQDNRMLLALFSEIERHCNTPL